MFRILHLSDLHARDATRWATVPILTEARELLLRESDRDNIDVLAFTGDIAYSGKPREYEIAEEWIESACLSPSGLNLDRDRILFVPGNHDVDRALIRPSATALEDALARATSQEKVAAFYTDSGSLSTLHERHQAYSAFCERIRRDTSLALSSWTQHFEYHGLRIAFEGYCSSWLCRGDDDPGRLLIGQPQLSERQVLRSSTDILIALLHHPLSDLMPFDEKNVDTHFRNHHQLVLRGHLHDPAAVFSRSNLGSYMQIAAGSLYETFQYPNSFNIIDLSDDLMSVDVRTYVWTQGKWILHRNLNPDSTDGILHESLSYRSTRGAQRDSTDAATPLVTAPDPTELQIVNTDSDAPQPTSAEEATKLAKLQLDGFPRFKDEVRPEDMAVRQSLLEEALLAADASRFVEIRAEWGTNPHAFIRALATRLKQQHGSLTVLHARCSGASTGPELQTALALNARLPVSVLGAALGQAGNCLILLDDVRLYEEPPSHEASARETIQTFLDVCEGLTIVALSQGPLRINSDSTIQLGPLDAADTRAYMSAHQDHAIDLDSAVDYDRIHKATGGLPRHIDTLLQALAYTDINGALFDFSSAPPSEADDLPIDITGEIVALASASDEPSTRAYTMLTVLCILEQGESLDVIKRIQPQSPLWPIHAKLLEDIGLLDVIDESPNRKHRITRPSRRDKLLRVPRVVRDYVNASLSQPEKNKLIDAAASLYFGSDWKTGSLRVRSRPSSPSDAMSTESSNEVAIVRNILTGSPQKVSALCSVEQAMTLALKYVKHLHSKGLYGEAYEAARDFLGVIDNIPELADCHIEVAELQLLAGKSARMLGEHSVSVDMLTAALPVARASGVKDRIEDVLISLALSHEGQRAKHEAIAAANEVISISQKNSGHYLQAQAIIAGFEEDDSQRRDALIRLETRARNKEHITVADNIAIHLARESNDTEEKLAHLARVRTIHEREYNYVRATIMRIETLLDASRLPEITDLDKRDLVRSYNLCFTQRMGGIFDWCHRVMWRFLEAIGDRNALRQLFMYSSFIWRLRGDTESELRYVQALSQEDLPSVQHEPGRVAALIRYCQARIALLLAGSSNRNA